MKSKYSRMRAISAKKRNNKQQKGGSEDKEDQQHKQGKRNAGRRKEGEAS